jgi:hypothetical protein
MSLQSGMQGHAAAGGEGGRSYGSGILRGFGNRIFGPGCKQSQNQAMAAVAVSPRDWAMTYDLLTVLPNYAIDDVQARYNQTLLFQYSLISGREGTDYANPYNFLANMFTTKAELAPAYSTRMQTPEEISANIIASSNALYHAPAGRLR